MATIFTSPKTPIAKFKLLSIFINVNASITFNNKQNKWKLKHIGYTKHDGKLW